MVVAWVAPGKVLAFVAAGNVVAVVGVLHRGRRRRGEGPEVGRAFLRRVRSSPGQACCTFKAGRETSRV